MSVRSLRESLFQPLVQRVRSSLPNIYQVYSAVKQRRATLESAFNFAKTQVVTMSFSISPQVAGDEVSIAQIVFWDGTQNHIIYDEAGGLLIPTLEVPYGATVGFTTLYVMNKKYPTALTAYCEYTRGTNPMIEAENSSWLTQVWDAKAALGLTDWAALLSEAITINVGVVTP